MSSSSRKLVETIKRLVVFILRESDLLRSPVFIFVLIASGSRTALIFLINETAARGGPNFFLFAGLIAAALILLAFSHWASLSGAKLVQSLQLRMRRNLTKQLLNADVSFFLRRGHGELYHSATHHIAAVSGTATRITGFIQAVLVLLFCLGYMFLEMPSSVLATVIALALGVTAFFVTEGPASRAVAKTHHATVAYHNSLNDILRGFKELRLRLARRRATDARVEQQINDAADAALVSERHYSYGQMGANGALISLLIAIVVILPLMSGADSVTTLQILTLVLFSFGPIETVVGNLPAFARTAISFQELERIETELSQNAEVEVSSDALEKRDSFETLELRGVKAHLSREVGDGTNARDTFTLGPIDLTLRPGESVFITGGNGMGKSTLLQLLTGLRHPDEGQILLDGQVVTRDNVAEYRSVFSAVFSEFYLFRHLDGLSEEDRKRLQEHIEEMGLVEGISIVDNQFTSLELSTGQLRRLALSLALAEERPIVVLDEFASDQDPGRRKFFYDVLVPRLAKAGHCLIAVTHDEHCFDKSDRLIRMEDGKIISDSALTGAAIPAAE